MPITFDTSGFQQVREDAWQHPDTGDMLTSSYYDLVPDLPAPLDELTTLRRRLTESRAETGGLIEAHVVGFGGLPALLRLEKYPLPNQSAGLVFAASFVVPRTQCSAALTLLCPEAGPTGVREAILADRIGLEHMYPPHPYAPEVTAALPYSAADDPRWDAEFPDHPLSRARRWLTHTCRTAGVDPRFAALPAFTGPLPSFPDTTPIPEVPTGGS
ncbi:hypothetical protein [Nocardia transvalensis]|uniref:hypothetical protein n=1 Tax=Nocardia transvalensis TaxID=37333 RepID=UPI0018935BD4|nr:hypothetical protein [Nocardia transvalensis]MBF6330008.1 hypothetical protein [Nocardia transvalensis]